MAGVSRACAGVGAGAGAGQLVSDWSLPDGNKIFFFLVTGTKVTASHSRGKPAADKVTRTLWRRILWATLCGGGTALTVVTYSAGSAELPCTVLIVLIVLIVLMCAGVLLQ